MTGVKLGGPAESRRRHPSPTASLTSDASDMPPGRNRSVNPQGRQKSCSECAKAKRKCDLEQPNCARCARQHLACVYPLQPRTQATSAEETPAERFDFSADDIAMEFLEDVEASSVAFDLDVPAMPTASSNNVLDFDFSTGTSSLASLTDMLNDTPNTDDQMAMQRTPAQVTKPFSQGHLSPFARSRVEYGIEQIELAPKMMVEKNCTPWAHCMLYEDHMPRSVQDAYAACALYITRNEINGEHVARYITSRLEELTALPMPTADTDVLARAQALILYQIMLVFGGDARLYARAETLLPHLEDVGSSLLSIAAELTDTVGSLPLYPSSVARSAWKSYIFGESVRRTILSLYNIVAVCSLLRGQLSSCSHDLAFGNRVTLSAHLWKAKTAFDFTVAWNERKHFLVHELDFTEILKDAKPDDLDIFARVMLVGLQGVDDMRGWFYLRGGTL